MNPWKFIIVGEGFVTGIAPFNAQFPQALSNVSQQLLLILHGLNLRTIHVPCNLLYETSYLMYCPENGSFEAGYKGATPWDIPHWIAPHFAHSFIPYWGHMGLTTEDFQPLVEKLND
ncbi:MAG: hypothetical protein AAGB22_08235, partial [Bacteroidota bacterium]